VKIEPNLRRWLEIAIHSRESVAPLNLRVGLLEEESGEVEKWPFNGLRHSYGSYRLGKNLLDAPRILLHN